MDNRHASLGRRTLEEIRQKRAAERLSKAASGPDLTQIPISSSNAADAVSMKKSESGARLNEIDISSLVSQLKDMQKRNMDLDEENRILSSKLQSKDTENDMLQKRLNDLEQNAVPSLRRALKDVAMEKDAAVVSREDLSAQLRTIKKRLKEAEEEQYRAEEDAASLRAELNSLQQQAMSGPVGGMLYPPDHVMVMERELSTLKSQLEQESRFRQQEQQRLAEEQARIAVLVSEKQDLEQKLATIPTRVTEEEAPKDTAKALSEEDRERLEKQLHDMAVAIERLEMSRQKLLMEIDSQSTEIERLFEENSNLSSAYEEANKVVVQWEEQVKECLTRNDELRSTLHKYRMEQAMKSTVNENVGVSGSGKDSPPEITSLKAQLVNEQNRAESLSAEILQLSARLQQATQAYNSLARLYKPVLRNIESSLIKMKQDSTVSA